MNTHKGNCIKLKPATLPKHYTCRDRLVAKPELSIDLRHARSSHVKDSQGRATTVQGLIVRRSTDQKSGELTRDSHEHVLAAFYRLPTTHHPPENLLLSCWVAGAPGPTQRPLLVTSPMDLTIGAPLATPSPHNMLRFPSLTLRLSYGFPSNEPHSRRTPSA